MARGRTLSVLLAAALLLGGGTSAWSATFDTLYQNGTIYTMTDILGDDGKMDFTKVKDLVPENAKKVEVVAVKDGKIVFAGTAAEASTAGYTEANAAAVVDLKGKTMMPGFVDGHGHFPSQGRTDLYTVFLGSEPLGKVNTLDQLVSVLNDACGDKDRFPNGVYGSNYDDTLLDINAHPTWQQLEEATQCKTTPVVIGHISGHMKVANKAALMKYKLMQEDGTPDEGAYQKDSNGDSTGQLVAGVVTKDGKLTGLLQETVAMDLLKDPTVPSKTMNTYARANEVYLGAGVTTVDMGAEIFYTIDQAQEAIETKKLTARALWHPYFTGLYAVYNLDGLYYKIPDNLRQYATPKMLFEANPAIEPDFGSESDAAEQGKTPRIGQDLTIWKPNSSAMLYYYMSPYTIQDEAAMPKERILHGAYKILGDGSPQGYTAWLKSPGYYDWGSYTKDKSATYNARMYTGGTQGDLAKTKYHDPEAMVGPDGTIENVPPQDMHYLIRFLHKYGLSSEVHTNGTACAEVWLEALEMAVTENPTIEDTRDCTIHAQTIERQQLERMMGLYDSVDPTMATQMWGFFTNTNNEYKQYLNSDPAWQVLQGISKEELAARMAKQHFFASFFMNHVYYYGERHSDIFFGPGRAKNISPAGWAVAYNVPFSFHNDTNVTPIEPLRSIKTAVSRVSAKNTISDGGVLISGSGKDLDAKKSYVAVKATDASNSSKYSGLTRQFYDYDQRINVLQAMVAHTVAPAWQNKVENRIGSIQKNLNADFVILDDDPVDIAAYDPTRIDEIRIATSIVADNAVYGLLPDADTYVFSVQSAYYPGVNDDNTISNVSFEVLDSETADKASAVKKGETRYGMVEVTATITQQNGTSKAGVMQMSILGNGATASTFKLANASTGQNFTYTETVSEEADYFYIASASDPLTILGEDEVLNMDEPYIVYFTLVPEVSDQAQTWKLDLTTTGPAPNNNSPIQRPAGDDDSSGCTIGTTPDYGVTALLCSLLVLLGVRSLRRRNG